MDVIFILFFENSFMFNEPNTDSGCQKPVNKLVFTRQIIQNYCINIQQK